jgi:DNA-binding NtrC family response regulator
MKGHRMECSVLVVSDTDTKEWKNIASYLKKKNYILQTASSAKNALQVIKKESVNIVISDYNLSNVHILKFLRKIKTVKPAVEVIFLSEKPTLAKAIDAMKAGAYDFYDFPVNMRLLTAVIQKAVEKQTLHDEKIVLEQKVKERFDFGKLVGRSRAMKNVMDIVRSVAAKNVNILITGETGTGKEMIANLIHYNSARATKPFIKMNCAAFGEGVLESELFGHEKGAFTGAITKRIGRFELADGGTIFIDEIGDMPLGTQIKLLRVLQEKEFEKVGGNETIKVDVRVLAATNQDLKQLIKEKKFREDLYYRLNVVHVTLPPLRERKDDIPTLVSTFMNKMNEEKGYLVTKITREAMQMLLNYSWPGNVRELENTVESAMALSEKDLIEPKFLPAFLLFSQTQKGDFYQLPQNLTLSEIEQEIIKIVLERTGGNKTKAAKHLGIGLRTLQRKVQGI